MPWNHRQGIFQVGHADSTRIDWFGAIQDDQPVVDDGRLATERWGDVVWKLGDTRGGCLRLTEGDMWGRRDWCNTPRTMRGFVWGWGDSPGTTRCRSRRTVVTITFLFHLWFTRCYRDRHRRRDIRRGTDTDLNFWVKRIALQNTAPSGSAQWYL